MTNEQALTALREMERRETRFVLEVQRENTRDLLDRTATLDDSHPERRLAIRAATYHVEACQRAGINFND